MAIWFGIPTIDDARASHVGLLASHLGIEFTEWGDDFLRGTMPVEPRTRQPMGYLHGGASLVLAETLGSVAANFVVDYSKFRCLGQDINANHVGFQVSNIETVYARAKANGAITVSDGGIIDFHNGKAAMIRDSDVGGYILLWQPAR